MKKNGALQEFCRVAKISKPAEFRRLQNFASCKMLFLLPLFTCLPLFTSPVVSRFCLFVTIFLFLPILSLVIAIDFGSFCIFAWLGQYINSCTIIKDNFWLSNKIGGKLSAFLLFSIFSRFLPFSLTFWVPKHPPRMTTRRMSS